MALTRALDGLSSISALGLSQPEAITGLVALGIVATGAVVLIAHKKWENYEEKKHKEEIEDINRRHKRFLEKIEVPGYGIIKGFPPIFKFGTDKDSISVDSLHYTIEEIKDIGSHLPHVDSVLASYRHCILSAILKLKEYYLSRDNHHDTTAGVLSYLLNILQNRCLSFEGYDYDSAYLSVLTDFIDDYASKEDRENSQHFKRLRPVYAYLLEAKHHLDKHKESLSLRDLVDELRDICINDSNRLLRLLVKMIVPEKDKELADTVAIDELRDEILRREYIKTEVWGTVLSKFHEVKLPDSVFKHWIRNLANYYLESLNPTSILREKTVMQPVELFAFNQWAKALGEQSKPKKKDKKIVRKNLELIRLVFKNSRNFINTMLAGTEKKPEFVVVKEEGDVLERTLIMANFAHLIHGIISLQAFCSHLLHSIEQLGAIYINDPRHFTEIFTVLDNLCAVVECDLKKNKQAFIDLSKASKNTMRLAKEGLFPKEIEVVLESVEHMLLKHGTQIKEYKNIHVEPAEMATENSVYEMLAVAQFFEKMYMLPQDGSKPQCIISRAPSTTGVPDTHIKSVSPFKNPPPEKTDVSYKKKVFQMETVLNDLSNQVNKQISAIKKEQPIEPKFAKYLALYSTLRALQIKCTEMLKEQSPTQDRLDKINKIHHLVHSLYQTTLTLLSLSQQERTKQAPVFIKKIHEELNNPENSVVIDKHRDRFSKFIYDHFGFFHTATRTKLSGLEQAYKGLQAT